MKDLNVQFNLKHLQVMLLESNNQDKQNHLNKDKLLKSKKELVIKVDILQGKMN